MPGHKKAIISLLFVILLLPPGVFASKLKVLTSADAESNALQSFIIVPDNALLPEGIKHNSHPSLLARQVPFVIELINPPGPETDIQWSIKARNLHHKTIDILSSYHNKPPSSLEQKFWQSDPLGASVYDRHKLIFTPGPVNHSTSIYKKGRGQKNNRQKYGGGSILINNQGFNPKIGYDVSVSLIQNNAVIDTYKTKIIMDKKDMIRQEYINHYNIQRYGYGSNGAIPIPRRDEITALPEIKTVLGNPLTESRYNLLINDGIQNIASSIAMIYQLQLETYKNNNQLKNIANETLPVPDNPLWLSGGWRNPERNEWYSNAVNGVHQRGGAVDFIIKSPPGHINTAISYWILWLALENNKDKLDAFWQLETNGRPMRTNEFTEDIEPRNGIPDAFDKADHLHVNVIYNE
ncbi:MAG: hypothetical protein OEY87_02215 [Gammaproteobacteria bacterium]|nr:hypothetical protein [Gammaproteobacteria bacterium]MDH5734914.1 hypothetical protein [Gammaproteobacteria bacterium]